VSKKAALIVLDGYGIGPNPLASAIAQAKTPFMDSLWARYPHTTLRTSGRDVGLPDGQMGNSEVGHMNLGAGRVMYQDLVRLNIAVEDKSLYENVALKAAFAYAEENQKPIHFIGLVSDGGVHSHINHLKGLLSMGHARGFSNMFVHAFTDGRDCDPKSGLDFIQHVENHMGTTGGKLASIIGRYYAMDRDKRWERVKLAYDLLVNGVGEKSTYAVGAISKAYAEGVTDEFINPIVLTENGEPIAKIADGDVVISFNFRTDRGREITLALTQQAFPEQGMKPLNLHYVTMTNYDDTFKNVHIAYDKDNISNTLGEVLSNAGKSQIRIAETEKYPHVTFFFSGGREQPFVGETRIMCPSPKVATYDLQPEMSAFDVRDKIVAELHKGEVDFVCLNFANPDMVGHTGVFSAAVKAVETVDTCLKDVVEAGLKQDYAFIILADHGNADVMFNEDGSPNTAHTTNPVPCILVGNHVDGFLLKEGRLGDIAPTLLDYLEIEKPSQMTGESLILKK
jgi:2,3-bisphosphoglycerate-independent phosphoglycerate mutase